MNKKLTTGCVGLVFLLEDYKSDSTTANTKNQHTACTAVLRQLQNQVKQHRF